MEQFLRELMPNVMNRLPGLWTATVDTIIMMVWSGAISVAIGLVLGIILIVTRPQGILENKFIFQILDKLVNFFRAIPFIILLTAVMPISRGIMGTAIGVRGAIVPLIFGTVPFFARQIESALATLDKGLIEAALSMGCSPFDIIIRVYLKESFVPIVRGTMITIISLLGLTAMAGAVGAGGLGDFAIIYGHDRNQTDITYVTVIVLVVMVSIVQIVGSRIIKKLSH